MSVKISKKENNRCIALVDFEVPHKIQLSVGGLKGMTKIIFHLSYDHIISVENLLGAWRGLVRGKRHKPDVQAFTFRLMDNILLKVKHYLRYADDFVLLSPDRGQLIESLSYMGVFLHKQLKLILHPDKVSLKTLASGVDYLGNDLPDYLIFALLLV